MIYILTVIHNRKEKTEQFLYCLQKQTFRNFKVVVVDDGSHDESDKSVKKYFSTAKIIYGDGNLWWTKGINTGLKYILSGCKPNDYILLINDDTKFSSNYLKEIHKSSEGNDRAIVGSISKTDQGGIIRQGIKYSWRPYKIESVAKEPDTFSSRGVLVPIEVFQKIGLLDEKRFPHYTSDYDFFYRAKLAGYRLIIDPHISVITEDGPRNKDIFFRLFSRKSAGNIFNESQFIFKHSPGLFWKLINIARSVLDKIRTVIYE